MTKFVRTLALLSAFAFGNGVSNAATLTIINVDPPGTGFNDPTPAAAVGGNTGLTLGQQRLNAFQHAANIWGSKLSSAVEIKIRASFGPLECEATSGVLGSAGPTRFTGNFPNAPRANTFYPVALASALSGTDRAATVVNPDTGLVDGASIVAEFNGDLGKPGCLQNTSFYLGLDALHGSQIDLVTVLLHEFGHGLGFTSLVNLSTGAEAVAIINGNPVPFDDIYSVFIRDNSVGLNWNVMNDAQRFASRINNGNVVFDGTNTTDGASMLLNAASKDPANHPKLFAPNPVQGGSSISHFDTTASPNQLMEPAINTDLTHNVDLPNDLTTRLFQDLGWPLMAGGGVMPPTNVVATGNAAGDVDLSWTAASGATSYRVYRSLPNNAASFSLVMSGIAGTAFTDTTPSADSAYLYKVRSFNGATESADSNVDVATTVVFTDPTLAAGTSIKAAHFTQMRTAANALGTLAGVGTGSYTDATLNSTVAVKRLHVIDIVTHVNLSRGVLLLAPIGVPSISGGTTGIQASHVTGMRAGVQ